ncbi:hypothetical protein H072_6374 [Dactylellina haptotyla CBS 200.50]|uniref:Uncharacterized protein n=1 Tax=Dactylellina haptotyla (strain CBS 200.50) TaxID=1284197 RepID=S8BWX0_DACHA|nr:hypothetical protein H072_6374 [Dactylellina haptotyla CBS 200.50]
MGLRKLNFFKNLTRLDLCERAHIRPDIFASNVFKPAVVGILKSAPEKVKTLGGNVTGSLSHWGEDVPDVEYAINNSEEFQQALPPSLTEYNVVLEDSEIFPFHGYNGTKKLIDPHLVIYGARETIKRLRIGTNIKRFNPSYRFGGALLGNMAVPAVYPNLVSLEIHFSLMQGTDTELRQIASSFPNLEELKFFSTFWKRPTSASDAAMLGLKRLKRATLFLPLQTTLPPMLSHATCRILRDFVVEWTECGLDLLEEVQFVVHSLHHDVMNFGFCIVSRGDDPTGYTFRLRQVSLPASDELLEPFDPFWTKYRLANKLLMGDISIADRYPEDFISLHSSGILA